MDEVPLNGSASKRCRGWPRLQHVPQNLPEEDHALLLQCLLALQASQPATDVPFNPPSTVMWNASVLACLLKQKPPSFYGSQISNNPHGASQEHPASTASLQSCSPPSSQPVIHQNPNSTGAPSPPYLPSLQHQQRKQQLRKHRPASQKLQQIYQNRQTYHTHHQDYSQDCQLHQELPSTLSLNHPQSSVSATTHVDLLPEGQDQVATALGGRWHLPFVDPPSPSSSSCASHVFDPHEGLLESIVERHLYPTSSSNPVPAPHVATGDTIPVSGSDLLSLSGVEKQHHHHQPHHHQRLRPPSIPLSSAHLLSPSQRHGMPRMKPLSDEVIAMSSLEISSSSTHHNSHSHSHSHSHRHGGKAGQGLGGGGGGGACRGHGDNHSSSSSSASMELDFADKVLAAGLHFGTFVRGGRRSRVGAEEEVGETAGGVSAEQRQLMMVKLLWSKHDDTWDEEQVWNLEKGEEAVGRVGGSEERVSKGEVSGSQCLGRGEGEDELAGLKGVKELETLLVHGSGAGFRDGVGAQLASFLEGVQLGLRRSERMLCRGLVALADAMDRKDEARVVSLMKCLQSAGDPGGSSVQRLVFYFQDALLHRIASTGFTHSFAPQELTPKLEVFIQMMSAYSQKVPLLRFWSYATNGAIYDALKGKPRVHIVDLALWTNQWGPLLRQLANQPCGPPHVRFTAVDTPDGAYLGLGMIVRPCDLRAELEKEAEEAGLPFEFRVVQVSLVDLRPEALELRGGESLAISCGTRMSFVPDDGEVMWNPRNSILKVLRLCNPEVVTIADFDADFNNSSFMVRVRAALVLFLDVFLQQDRIVHHLCLYRQAWENLLGRYLANVIACEGTERFIRSESAEKWEERMNSLGFSSRRFVSEVGHKKYLPLSKMVWPSEIEKGSKSWRLRANGSPSLLVSSYALKY